MIRTPNATCGMATHGWCQRARDASPRTQSNLQRLLRLYTETNDPRQAATVRARLAQK